MTTDNEQNVSDLNKIIIKRIHGGRKHHTRFYQSALADKQPSSPAEKSCPTLLQQILFMACGLMVGLLLVLYFKNYTLSSLIDLLPFAKNDSVIVVPNSNDPKPNTNPTPSSKSKQKSSPQQQPRELEFSQAKINKAMEEVQEERERKSAHLVTSSNQSNSAYQYKIELFSGGTIYTDNADIKEDVITYKSNRGLVISIDRDEIKSMKWVMSY
jgi:hypothetical protein